MLTATTNNNQVIRNYVIATASVMLLSVGVADLFNSPARVGQQERLNGYVPYVTAALVNQAKSLAR